MQKLERRTHGGRLSKPVVGVSGSAELIQSHKTHYEGLNVFMVSMIDNHQTEVTLLTEVDRQDLMSLNSDVFVDLERAVLEQNIEEESSARWEWVIDLQ